MTPWRTRCKRAPAPGAPFLKLAALLLLLLVYLRSFFDVLPPAPPPPRGALAAAWRTAPETCPQWISAARLARSYVDAYFIGAQKAATSELSTRLYDLGALHPRMRKEWHFLHALRDGLTPQYAGSALHLPYRRPDLRKLRLRHYLSGFPHRAPNVTSDADVPLVDNAPRETRKLVYDGSVEYMVSDRVAFLAHALNPHAKLLVALRDPVARALSQYNMMIRIHNRDRRKLGQPERPATAREFDRFVRKEMAKLGRCGYDWRTGDVDRNASQLLGCMFPKDGRRFGIADLLYVTRGLYHLHIATWRRFFPDHRMLFIRFADVTRGDEGTMQDIANFLCVRAYPAELLKRFRDKASNVSFGVLAARKGVDKTGGFDTYAGKDRYLVKIFDETRAALEEFYAPANRRLFQLMGRRMF